MRVEILFDETFAAGDGSRASRNIWYGYLGLSVDGEYGKDIRLTGDLMDTLCDAIRENLSGAKTPAPTETNWYFYGDAVAKDAIGDDIRPTIMVRAKDGAFLVHINLSDHDFAVHIDAVQSFQGALERRLAAAIMHPWKEGDADVQP